MRTYPRPHERLIASSTGLVLAALAVSGCNYKGYEAAAAPPPSETTTPVIPQAQLVGQRAKTTAITSASQPAPELNATEAANMKDAVELFGQQLLAVARANPGAATSNCPPAPGTLSSLPVANALDPSVQLCDVSENANMTTTDPSIFARLYLSTKLKQFSFMVITLASADCHNVQIFPGMDGAWHVSSDSPDPTVTTVIVTPVERLNSNVQHCLTATTQALDQQLAPGR